MAPARAASDRLAWAADLVAPGPAERILEVGSGHGVLLDLLAERVPRGLVVGVDRSPSMTAAALRRNEAAAAAGRVRLVTGDLTDVELDDAAFDVVVAFNVRAFWTPPAPEWDVVARVLAPVGRVLIAYQVEGVQARLPVEETVRRVAAERGFRLLRVHRGDTRPTASLALELRR